MLQPQERKRWLVVHCFMAVILLGAAAWGSTRSEYDLTFDSDGVLAGGGGDGDGWYYYKGSDEYIMWFYNQPYDPTRSGTLDVWAWLEPVISKKPSMVEISYGWSTPEWSALGKGHPPMPADTGNTSSSPYIHSVSLYREKNQYLGESVASQTVDKVSYNPDWICVIVRGKNVHVYRFINHDCVVSSQDSGGFPPDTGTQLGACCNQSTGDCYIASTCTSPYVWLGAGTSCSACKVENYTWDYGDAPASYPVLASQNGARHTVKTSMYLGQCVSRDKDGQPSSTATGDTCDDGVEFTSSLVPGSSATVRITASTHGVINAWIDFNRDGDWADAGEHILTDEPVIEGTNIVTFLVPLSASAGDTFARFRFSTATGLSYTGLAGDGEVEDYRIVLASGSGGNTAAYAAQAPSNGYYAKWVQTAKATGRAIQGWPEISSDASGPILADDWSDSDRRPAIGLRWWGCFDSWTNSALPSDVPAAFNIGIWTDAVGSGSPSTLVWETTSSNWTWAYSGVAEDPRGLASGAAVFEICCMLSQDKWFYPTPSMGTRYWVSISAVYSDATSLQHPWGIMTRQRNYGSAATRIQAVGSAVTGQSSQWPPQVGSIFLTGQSVVYPQNVSWDLSFELISSKPGGGSGTSTGILGDLNGDGKVDAADMAELINLMVGAQVFH